MALIDKETIRAEIDKRYAEYRAKMKTDDFTYYEGMADALDHLKQFLDTIPEQSVSDCHELKKGLEEEIHDYMFRLGESDSSAGILRDKPGYMRLVEQRIASCKS